MKLAVSPSMKICNLEHYENGEIHYLFVHDCRQIVWINNDLEQTRLIPFGNESLEEFDNCIVHLKCLAISSSSHPLLVASSNRYVKMFSLSPNEPKQIQTPFHLTQKSIIVGLDQITSLSFVIVSSNSVQIFTYKSKEFHQTSKIMVEDNIVCCASDSASGLVLIENSGISLWKGTDKKLINLKRFPLPINCKAIQTQLDLNWIIIGTISGQIQIISRDSGKLICEVQAHSSALTSVIRWNNYILSTSEDHFVRIFKIVNNTKESFQIDFQKQKQFHNLIPIGICAFHKQNQTVCAVSCFESLQIETFTL